MPGHFLASARGQSQPPPPPSRGNESPSDVRSVAGRCPFAKLLCLSVFRFNPVKGPSPRRYRVCGPHQPLDRLSTPEKEQLSISYQKYGRNMAYSRHRAPFYCYGKSMYQICISRPLRGAQSVLTKKVIHFKIM
jgi:hypothetical protein